MRISLILLSAFFICFHVRTAGAQPTKPIVPGQYGYFEIRAEHESPDLSLPACVAMAMNFYTADSSQWTAKGLAVALGMHSYSEVESPRRGRRVQSNSNDLFYGISFDEIQAGIKKMGYTWDRWQWPADSIGFENGIDAIEQSIDARKPVILDEVLQYFNRRGDRWTVHQALLVFGYDEKAGELIVMDPTVKFPGKRHIPFDELKTIWHRGAHFHALFTAPPGVLPTGHRE
jgi:Peptidase_C39 like family